MFYSRSTSPKVFNKNKNKKKNGKKLETGGIKAELRKIKIQSPRSPPNFKVQPVATMGWKFIRRPLSFE